MNNTGLANLLRPVVAPDELWGRIEAALDETPAAPPRPAWLAIAAAVLVTVALGMLWTFRLRGPDLAQVALTTHQQIDAPLDFRGANSFDLRTWVARNCALTLNLPDASGGGIEILGARRLRYNGRYAAAVAYRMGHHRATLLVAPSPRSNTLQRVPAQTAGPDGTRVFTWQSGDQLYALISEAPEARQACALCHRDNFGG